ncbi:hypothetical protein FQN60_005286 [Etheostoma spectabile]|uniref:Uncharacterized protein n=1 Tax=Etheostoma spectabile TaxID=54343 RepID=A0A5J5C9C6_9PERO|nr:hypothetical protein FQN60_005286 [Etheostoma spectabile]
MSVNSASALPTLTGEDVEEEDEEEPSQEEVNWQKQLFGSEVRREWTGDLRPSESSCGEELVAKLFLLLPDEDKLLELTLVLQALVALLWIG